MAIISVPTSNRGKPTIKETSEYEGLWINIGVLQVPADDAPEGTEPNFVRLPRGVAVADLQLRKIFDNMAPEFAAQANLMNQLILAIQKKALGLDEGESVTINLEAQLYRRQEESAISETPEENTNLEAALFGG